MIRPRSTHTQTHRREAGGGAVAAQCREALTGLRAALLAALDRAGIDSAHPREAARRLGVDKNLMWRVSKVVGQPDVFEAVRSVPRRTAFGRLCEALTRAGVPGPLVDDAAAAHAAFDRLVDDHAGDRESFELIVGGLGADSQAGASLEQARKLAFRGNVGVFGVQAHTQVFTTLLAPSADQPGCVDAAQVFGLCGLRRLRADASWTLALRREVDEGGCRTRAGGGVPLDPDAPADGSGLLEAFSSRPFPELGVEQAADGTQRYVLESGELGRTGELTALFGMLRRGLGTHQAGSDRFAQFIAHLLTPVEHLHIDLAVHEDLTWALEPRAALFGRVDGRTWHFGCGREGLQLPCSEPVTDLGRGLGGAPSPRLSAYPELLAWAFGAAGWDAERFRLFRFELSYPPMPAQAILFSELLQGSGAEKGRR